MTHERELVTVGRVVRPHGIRGELVVEASGDVVGSLRPGDRVRLGGGREAIVAGVRPHAGRWLLALEGVGDRDAAEALRGRPVRVDAEWLPEPEDDEFYIDDLLGARVETADGRDLGRVAAVHSGAAQDLLELRRDSGMDLIPMVRDWLLEVDLEAGVIRMDLPPGFHDAAVVVEEGTVAETTAEESDAG